MVRPAIPSARRPLVVAVVAVLVLLLGGFTAYGIGEVQERREARTQATEESRARAAAEQQREAEQEAEQEADREAQRDAAEESLALAWAASVTEAAAQLTATEAVLAASEGRVADDAVRLALAQSLDVLRPLLAEPARLPVDLRAGSTAVSGALAAVTTSSAAVTAAQAEWQAAQDGAAAQAAAQARVPSAAAPPPGVGGPPSTGAGPDCGGPASYEPPKNDGSPTFYTSTPSASGDGTNGKVPASSMSRLGWCTDSQGNGQWLRSDAAAAMTRLNEAFRAEFGENIAVDLSYRSFDDQVAMREYYGTAAARPGTSNHGLGLAVDTWEWAAYSFGSPRYEWLVANAPAYGWAAPSWARQDGSNPEYWHFEYVG